MYGLSAILMYEFCKALDGLWVREGKGNRGFFGVERRGLGVGDEIDTVVV